MTSKFTYFANSGMTPQPNFDPMHAMTSIAFGTLSTEGPEEDLEATLDFCTKTSHGHPLPYGMTLKFIITKGPLTIMESRASAARFCEAFNACCQSSPCCCGRQTCGSAPRGAESKLVSAGAARTQTKETEADIPGVCVWASRALVSRAMTSHTFITSWLARLHVRLHHRRLPQVSPAERNSTPSLSLAGASEAFGVVDRSISCCRHIFVVRLQHSARQASPMGHHTGVLERDNRTDWQLRTASREDHWSVNQTCLARYVEHDTLS
ncbi:hypothetical protein EMCRGX_G015365 [Ephydatia muelleri]